MLSLSTQFYARTSCDSQTSDSYDSLIFHISHKIKSNNIIFILFTNDEKYIILWSTHTSASYPSEQYTEKKAVSS